MENKRKILMTSKKIYLFLVLCCVSLISFGQTKDLAFDSLREGEFAQGGKFYISFSAASYDDIVFSCAISSSFTRAKYVLRLRYSLAGDAWFDVLARNGQPVQYIINRRSKREKYKINLPDVCAGKDSIRLCFYLIPITGKDDNINIDIDEIKLTGQYDKYGGVKPELSVFYKSNKQKMNQKENMDFGHIPLPYTYPQTRRIVISGKYLRDDVSLSIQGEDKSFFHVDNASVQIDSLDKKVVTITYEPLKIGSHSADLVISTSRLDKPYTINLTGSCAKAVEINSNLLSTGDIKVYNGTKFRIPVFSNVNYQMKFALTKRQVEKSKLKIEYRWYHGTTFLSTMTDDMRFMEETDSIYCIPLIPCAGSDYLQVNFKMNNETLNLQNAYFGTPFFKKAVHSGSWSDNKVWEGGDVPVMEDFVYIDNKVKLKVDDDVNCSMLVLGDSSNVEIEQDKKFYISGDISYGKGAWFVVHQDLPPKQWSYISSPVNDAKALIYSMRDKDNKTWLMKYNTGVLSEMKDYWSTYIKDPNYKLVPAQGYAVYTDKPLDVIYEGILCASNISYPLVYSQQDRWNLVGNPFTSPLSSKKLFEDLDQKIQGNALFFLDSKNGVFNPVILDDKEDVAIPSLTAFFVESLKDNTDINFRRSYQYIPSAEAYHWVNHNYLTLTIRNDQKSEYVILGMDERATDGFDMFDAHKLVFGADEDMPEVYFIVDSQYLAVNVFPSYPVSYDVGYEIGKQALLSLSLGNVGVLPSGISVLLEDKYNSSFQNLCDAGEINFTAVKGITLDRFRIHVLKAIGEMRENEKLNDTYLFGDKGRIILYDKMENTSTIYKIKVMDSQKKQLYQKDYNGGVMILDNNFPKGDYLIDILVDDVWINNIPLQVD